MTDLVTFQQGDLQGGEPYGLISMKAPRANALEPELLAALHKTLDALEKSEVAKALITGGSHFSTGGDVAQFWDAARSGQAEQYSDTVVPPLQSLILRMIEMPVLFASAVRGAVTGGAAGILFASDLAVAAPDAFVQPYYGVMGFAPDGGWMAVLPELVGGAVARSWLMANQRKSAQDLQNLGLIQTIATDPEDQARDLLRHIETGTARAAKDIFWHDTRRASVKIGLANEAKAFRKLIGHPTTKARMHEFLQDIR